MASTQSTVDFMLEQMTGAGEIRARKMFGEYGVYCDDKIVALICDDQLFVKLTDAGLSFLDTNNGAPPYPGAKDYLLVPIDKLEDGVWLSKFIRATTDALPAPKLKNT